MIYVGNLKERLLGLLVKSGRPVNHAKTVPVKVFVTSDPKRPNGYWTTVYKLPEEVADDDNVLANQQLLPTKHPQHKAKPPRTVPDIPQDVRKAVNDFVDKTFNNVRQKVYDFLIANNIKWDRCLAPNAKNIDYMRAKMALQSAIHFHGFDLNNPKPLPDIAPPQKATKPATPSKTSFKSVSDIARKKGTAYYDSLKGDRTLLYKNLKEWGIKWDEDKSDITNCMRAMNALNVAIDNGFDPFNPPAKENDPAAIPIPANATPRQKALIEHINKLTDIPSIEACARVGVVPEDNRAQDFIVSRLQASLVGTLSKASAQVKQRIDQEWGKGVLSRLQAKVQDTGKYSNDPSGFGKQISDIIAIEGCKKNVIQEGFQTLANVFNMAILTHPRETLATPIQNGSMGQNGGIRISDLIQGLNEGYSNRPTDIPKGFQSNMGYTGYDPDVYSARFKASGSGQDGFSLYLDKIASSTQNLEIKDTVDTLKQRYNSLLTQCEGNPNLMSAVLSSDTWSDKADLNYRPSTFGKVPLTSKPQAIAAVQQMDKTYNVLISELKKRGYTNNDIYQSLMDTVHNDNLEEFHIANDIIDFKEIKNSSNRPLLKKEERAWGTGSLLCALAKFHGEVQGDPTLEHTTPPEGCEEAWGYYKAAKQIQAFTSAQYVEAHKLSHELMGLTLTKKGQPLDYSTVNTTKLWKTQGISQSSTPSVSTDIVMTNLIMGHLQHSINTSIVQNITKNTQGQMFNNSGADYSGNFDYYSGTVMSAPSDKRFTQFGNNPGNGKTYTAQELSNKISSQLDKVPMYTENYLSNVKNYYISSGKSSMGESFAKFYNKGMEPILESPIKDILHDVAHNITGHTPNMAVKPRFSTQMAKKLNYVPYDFEHTSDKQPRLNYSSDNRGNPKVDKDSLLVARKKLLAVAKCSLQTESREISQALQAEMSGKGFDYKDSNALGMGEKDETNPNMNAPRRPLHSGAKVPPERNRVLVFNSPFFKINNSLDEESFNANHDKLMNNGKDTKSSEPLELYQGLSYSATAGLLKQDKDITDSTNASLGKGKYYSYKAGHAAEFVGDQHLKVDKVGAAVAARTPPSGIIGMATVMRGSATSNQGASALGKQLTSISGDHRSNPPLPDYELCLKSDGLSFTHHIVDVTVMNIGITAQRTNQGIVKATTKELVADTTGTSINFNYKEDMTNGY